MIRRRSTRELSKDVEGQQDFFHNDRGQKTKLSAEDLHQIKTLDLSQSQIAAKYKISQPYVSQIISGARKPNTANLGGRGRMTEEEYLQDKAYKKAAKEIPIPPGTPCAECGTTEDIVKHHINGDITDNRPENVLFLCRRCHAKLNTSHLMQKELDAVRRIEGKTLAEVGEMFGISASYARKIRRGTVSPKPKPEE